MDGRELSVDGRSVDGRSASIDGRSRLSASGMNIVSPRRPRKSPAQTTRSELLAGDNKSFHGMTLEEMQDQMEVALQQQNQRLSPQAAKQSRDGEARCARSILEANKQLIEEKQQRRVMDRQKSREFIEKILEADQRKMEAEKLQEVSKRSRRAELSQYYKSCIADKDAEKANAYREKLRHGIEDPHFPYTEGENIMNARQAQRAELQSEMQDFLRRQLEDNPPRRPDHFEKYGLSSPTRSQRHESSSPSRRLDDQEKQSPLSPSGETAGTADLIEAGLSKPHHCLQKTQAHKSRRLQDQHVISVLEKTVQRKKEELHSLATERLSEADRIKEGMEVNDVLRHETEKVKRIERKRNADFVRKQIEERQEREEQAVRARRAECHGYWGPEDKPPESNDKMVRLSADLVKQMEVNQMRKLSNRVRTLEQEQRLVNNSLGEIQRDRAAERDKLKLHQEVLVNTWASQRTIKEVQRQIASYDT